MEGFRADGTVSTNLRNRAIRYCVNSANQFVGVRFGVQDDTKNEYFRLNDFGTLTTSGGNTCETVLIEEGDYIASVQFQYSSLGVNRMVFTISNGEYRIAGSSR